MISSPILFSLLMLVARNPLRVGEFAVLVLFLLLALTAALHSDKPNRERFAACMMAIVAVLAEQYGITYLSSLATVVITALLLIASMKCAARGALAQ